MTLKANQVAIIVTDEGKGNISSHIYVPEIAEEAEATNHTVIAAGFMKMIQDHDKVEEIVKSFWDERAMEAGKVTLLG